MKWHVTYFYLATGMEGIPDMKDYGVVEAKTKQEACRIVAEREEPKHVEWMLSCLSAKPSKESI